MRRLYNIVRSSGLTQEVAAKSILVLQSMPRHMRAALADSRTGTVECECGQTISANKTQCLACAEGK